MTEEQIEKLLNSSSYFNISNPDDKWDKLEEVKEEDDD